MILVVFEVVIKEAHMDNYLALAAGLKEELLTAKGFVSSERFSSLVDERKLLSLSVWESEEAVDEWRNQAKHRMSQHQGRASLFESYTISIASVIRRYSHEDRVEVPKDSKKFFKMV